MFFLRLEAVLAIVINSIICLGVIIIRVFYADSDYITVFTIQSMGILTLVVLHSIAWFSIGGNDLSLSYLFFLMTFIFNAGKSILFIFYFDTDEQFFTFFFERDYAVVMRAMEFSYICLFVMSCAMLLSNKSQHIGQTKHENKIEVEHYKMLALKLTGLAFFLVSFPAALIDLKDMLLVVLTGGYFALYSGEQSYGAAGILKVLSFFLFPSLYLLFVAYCKNKKVALLILMFALFYSLVKMAMGARLVALVPFLIMLSLWDIYVRTINRKALYLTAATTIAVVFPLLSLLRVGGSIDEQISIANLLFHIIKEMSDSISPLVWVMQRVPIEIDFSWGNSFILALSTALPNLFWEVHPAKAGSLALWLVNEVNPWIAERGGGYGFSIFAEMYLNFYWLSLFPLFIISVLITRLSAVKGDPISTAFTFACFLGFLLWPRGELVAVARFILWNVGIPWICYNFCASFLKRYG